jgi:hypothetical protein
MSFSIYCIGKPDAVKRKLVETSISLSGQSKDEFDAVAPAIATILDQQVGNGVVQLNANGHATITDGVKTFGQVSIEVKPLGQFVE